MTAPERCELLLEEKGDAASRQSRSSDAESSRTKKSRSRSKQSSSYSTVESRRKPRLHIVQQINECNSFNTNNSNSASSNEDVFAYSKAGAHQRDIDIPSLHHRQVGCVLDILLWTETF